MQGEKTYRIRRNRYGNWYGYEGNRRVELFFATPYETQEEQAIAWLKAKQSEQGIFPAPNPAPSFPIGWKQ
jgi:hypothetical protein